MSHLIKIYAVCEFSYLRLWLLKSYKEDKTHVQRITFYDMYFSGAA